MSQENLLCVDLGQAAENPPIKNRQEMINDSGQSGKNTIL